MILFELVPFVFFSPNFFFLSLFFFFGDFRFFFDGFRKEIHYFFIKF